MILENIKRLWRTSRAIRTRNPVVVCFECDGVMPETEIQDHYLKEHGIDGVSRGSLKEFYKIKRKERENRG